MRSRRRWLRPVCWGLLAALAISAANSQWLPAVARTSDQDDGTKSLFGSYLAGRFARGQHDTTAAAQFYSDALARDPESDVLLEQAFLMEATEGRWPRAVELAQKLLERQDNHRVAHLVLGLTGFRARDYATAEKHFGRAGSGPIGELTSSLARAWARLAQGDVNGALALLEVGKQAEWAQYYILYHRALIADLGGRTSEARASYERLFKKDTNTPRTALAYAQHAARAGDLKLARQILKEHLDKSASEGHPTVRALRDQLESGAPVPLLVETVDQGVAEVFYGLGEALASETALGIGALYLQLALYVRPEFPFALAALANVHESAKRHAEAIALYDRIGKGSALETSIEIRKAINLNMLDRTDEAKALLDRLISQDPTELRTLDAVGTILRGRKRYAEAIDYYTRAISHIHKPEKRHWTYWYARGTCYERTKQWPLAEADLQKALQLSPDQPLVLNYLGYSWIDQNRNLKQGLSLIEKAVALKPEDGYIVDSLGWAHFRLGNFREAVRFLERAVELKPEDPVLNDHLGDALWRAGRTREARYQWQQALTLNPEPEDVDKIKAKLQKGLVEKTAVRNSKKSKEAAPLPAKKRVESKLSPTGGPVR